MPISEKCDAPPQSEVRAAVPPVPGPQTPELWFHRRATHYVEAQILFHLNQVGIFAELALGGSYSAAELAGRLGLEERTTETLLDYVFEVDDLLDRSTNGSYSLSPFGREVMRRFASGQPDGAPRINMFDVRVGCFEPVWHNLSRMLTGSGRYGHEFERNGAFAEDGVRKLAMKFWPTLSALLDDLKVKQAMEIGLTTGLLERIGMERPGVGLVGLDRSEASLRRASEGAAKMKVDSVKWLQGDVFRMEGWLKSLNNGEPGLIFSVHFHEFLAAGESKMIEFLRAIKKSLPTWRVLAFEQPRLPHEDRERISESQWLYAQSNVLIHHLIGNGRILDQKNWMDIGREAGCSAVDERSCEYLGYRAFVFHF